MKHHIMIALGLLLGIMFAGRTATALLEPGIGVQEAYLFGGLFLSGWLILGGLAEWREARAANRSRPDQDDPPARHQGP